MPQTSAAAKALRVSARRRVINDRWRDKLHFTERKFLKAIQAKQTDEAQKLYVALQSIADRMARRSILHRNTAARKKSRLAARLGTLSRPS